MISLAKLDPLAERGACAIETAFNAYQTEFKAITRRAKARFEQRDWHGAQSDAVARLELYKKNVDETVGEVRALLGDCAKAEAVWVQMKMHYSKPKHGSTSARTISFLKNSSSSSACSRTRKMSSCRHMPIYWASSFGRRCRSAIAQAK